MTIFTMHFFMQNDSYKKSGRDQQRGGQYEEEPPVITCFRNLWLLRLCWNFRLFRITYCLRFVVDVGVNGQLDTVFIQAFKYNNFLACKCAAVKGKDNVYRTVGCFSNKGGLGRYLLTVYQKWLTCGLYPSECPLQCILCQPSGLRTAPCQ